MPTFRSSTSLSRSNIATIRLAIEHVPVNDVIIDRRQLRRHPRAQVSKLACGIAEHGFLVPLVVDEKLSLVSGYARLAAAKRIGLREIPVVRVTHLSDEQLRLVAIFDNRIAEEGDWDEDALVLELEELRLEEPAIDFDLSGFDAPEIDLMTGRAKTAALSDLDHADEPTADAIPATRVGDLWLCGRHRLICGDSTNTDVIARLTDGARIRQLITDPPYNLPTKAFSSSGRHADFAMAAGELSKDGFTAFLKSFLTATMPTLIDGAFVYVFMDHKHIVELIEAGTQAGLTKVQMLVWIKGQAGMGSFYRSGYELVGVFRHGAAAGRNNIMLGAHGRDRSNVLSYPGVRGTKGGAKALRMHPTVKNVAMIADLILDASAPGDAVLDSFGGSGTTMIAAEKVDRTAYLCELSPSYVEAALERFNALGGEPARLADTGQTLAELRVERLTDGEA
jgi:hypothetical protein